LGGDVEEVGAMSEGDDGGVGDAGTGIGMDGDGDSDGGSGE
jgi:hypothetical protein